MTGTGNFEVAGGKILAPDGSRFVPVGVNLSGPWMYRDDATADLASIIADGWRFNLVRVNTCTRGGCDCCVNTSNVFTAANDLSKIVDRYTSRRVVVVVDYHQLRAGQVLTELDIGNVVDFWAQTASVYAGNPYVWFGIVNEPETGSGASARWFDLHKQAVQTIRDAGAENLIVCCDTWSGQGSGIWWDVSPVVGGYSGVLDYGSQLVDRRLVYDIHAYDVWGFPSTMDGTIIYTDTERDAKLRDYITRAQSVGGQAGGRAVVSLACGFYEWEQPDTGMSAHCIEAGPCPSTGSAQRLAVESLFRVAREFGTGVAAWPGYPLTKDWPSAPAHDLSNVTTFGAMVLAQRTWAAATYPPGVPDTSNTPPTVAVTAPYAGQAFTAGQTMALAAAPTDPAGAVLKVEFFADDAKVGEATNSPWTSTWANITAGQHRITAVATDNQAAITASDPVVVRVATAGGNYPPSVVMTNPVAETTVASGSSITLKAVAADPNGTISKVEFYDATTKLGEDTSGAAYFRVQDVSAVAHGTTIDVSATGPSGSDRLLFAWEPLNGSVDPASHYQTVASPTNYTIAGLTASTLYRVTVSAGTGGGPASSASAVTFIVATTTAAAGPTVSAGHGSPFEYTYSWVSIPAGTHQLTAVAIDNAADTAASAPVYLTATPGSESDDAVTPGETGPRYTFTATISSQTDLDAAGLPGFWNEGIGLWILSTTPPALNRLRIVGGIYYTAPGALQMNDCEIVQAADTDGVVWLADGAGEPKLSHCRIMRSVLAAQPAAGSIVAFEALASGWVEYCDVSGNASGITISGNHRVTRNWIHDLDIADTVNGPTVNIGISTDGTGANLIDGNFVDGDYVAGYTYAAVQATGGTATIEDNRTGGFAYHFAGFGGTKLTVTGNVLDSSTGGGAPVTLAEGASVTAWSGNRNQNGVTVNP